MTPSEQQQLQDLHEAFARLLACAERVVCVPAWIAQRMDEIQERIMKLEAN